MSSDSAKTASPSIFFHVQRLIGAIGLFGMSARVTIKGAVIGQNGAHSPFRGQKTQDRFGLMITHTNLQWFSRVPLKVLTASLLATLLVFPVYSTKKTAHLTYAAPNASCQLAWNIVPSPLGGTGDSGLGAIGVVSAHEIWAVGSYDNNEINQMLIERWDGASWSVLPSPGAGRLLDIAVVSANDIWAVGDRFVHWDGSAWSIVTESPGANAVTALASNNVWTAGFGDTIRHWDGSSWSVIPVPEINVPIKELNDIAFVSANDGWAVGIASYGHMDYWPLVFHWDGLTWSRVQTPDETGKHLSGLVHL